MRMFVSVLLILFISISFSAVIFNSVIVNDLGQNGNSIIQISSDGTNLCFLTNVSLNLYNFRYVKSISLNSPISMKIYNKIYVHTVNGLYIFTKNLTLIHTIKASFFDFDYDPDTDTIFLFKGNSVKFLVNYKVVKTFSFKDNYDYFSYDSFNKKLILAKRNGEFVVIDQILFTTKSFSYKGYDFSNIMAFNGKVYFLDKKSLFVFDYLVMKKTAYDPLWIIKDNSHFFLVFDGYVLDYGNSKRYQSDFIFKDITIVNSTLYFLYGNNVVRNNFGKTYYFVKNFKNIIYNNGNIVFYDPDRGLFKSENKIHYTHLHFLDLSFDPFKHYIVGIDGNNLYFLDSDYNITKSIKLNFIPISLKVDFSEGIVYISNSERKVFSYNYSSENSKGFSEVGKPKIFIPQFFEYYTVSGSSIDILDSYGNLISSFETHSIITSVTFSEYFGALFFVTNEGVLYEYDLSTGNVLKVQKILANANQVISVNSKVYVLDSSNQKLAVVSYDKNL